MFSALRRDFNPIGLLYVGSTIFAMYMCEVLVSHFYVRNPSLHLLTRICSVLLWCGVLQISLSYLFRDPDRDAANDIYKKLYIAWCKGWFVLMVLGFIIAPLLFIINLFL